MKQLLIAAMLVPALSFAQKVSLNTDEAVITFDLGTDVENGTISGLNAEVDLDLQDPSSGSIKASVDVESLNTDTPQRDEHLFEAGEHFDGANFPNITFESDRIVKTASGYMAYGKLTIKSTTQEVEMPFIHADNMLIGRIKLHTGNYGVYGDAPEDPWEVNCIARIQVPLN